MYGYEIVQEIRTRADALIAIGEGVVYPVLHGLERAGALKSRRRAANGRSRIYYAATPVGSRRLGDLSQYWSHLAAAIRKMLAGRRYKDSVR
jgi:PadR family transcriptional regulator PadR